MLGGREEMVFRKISVELLVNSSLYNFGDEGVDGDRTEIGWVGRITGLKDRVN